MTFSLAHATHTRKTDYVFHVGSVSFLNAKPLIYGLDDDPEIGLSLDVPSALLDGMRDGRYDVALLPVIDYQRMEGLRVLTAGGIGCDGPTLTVRIFSRVPIGQIRMLACDTDSHTSVALARVVLAESYGLRPEFVPLSHDAGQVEGVARLLIGDKVVAEEPQGFPHQMDLGDAWKRLTGLPFVFAAWMARPGMDLRDLPVRLARAKRQGLRHVGDIVALEAAPRGWPVDTALRYLTQYLRFDVGPREVSAIERFHALAHAHGVLDHSPRKLALES